MKLISVLIFAFIVVFAGFYTAGCSGGDDAIVKARDAISSRDYSRAATYARQARNSSHRQEANAILEYIKYEDNMLLAAYYSEDTDAARYMAPIIYDIDKECPRFNASALVLASAWGQDEMVKILLEAGADPNRGADSAGLTALMWTAKNFDERFEMAKSLVEAGAHINVLSNFGESPLLIAEIYKNPNIAAMLKKYSFSTQIIVNMAESVIDGDAIYYPEWEDNYRIYKIKTDMTDKQKINDDSSRHINIEGEWLYYENIDDEGKIYRIKTDGSGRQKLSDDRSWNATVQNGWIYYENVDDEDKIYKISSDGTSRQKLNDERSWYIKVSGDWIYYLNMYNHENGQISIYRIKTGGFGREKIIDRVGGNIYISGDWIYYVIFDFNNEDNHNRLYRLKTDKSINEMLNDDYTGHMVLEEEWIYYVNESDGSRLYKIKTDGAGRQKLNDKRTAHFNILLGWIYYINIDDGNIYRVKTDGTGDEIVEQGN